jgi:hypothetical protein
LPFTSPVEITVLSRDVQAPTFASMALKSGRLTFSGAANFDPTGSVVVVNGLDRFPIEVLSSGVVRTVKSASGTGSGLRLAKVLRKGVPVTLHVRTAAGGISTPHSFTR